MAKRKRPQASTSVTPHAGAAVPQVSTAISGVDTFVQPGYAGAPQAPVPVTQPADYAGSTSAQDLINLGKSFSMLSSSLQQKAQAERLGDKELYNWAEELAQLKKEMDATGEDLAAKVGDETIDALSHPAAAKGLCAGMAKLNASDAYGHIEANIEEWKNHPDGLDLAKTMERFDTQMSSSKGTAPNSRSDIYEIEYLKASSTYRRKFEQIWRTHISKTTISNMEDGLKMHVGSVLDAYSTSPEESLKSLENPTLMEIREVREQTEGETEWGDLPTAILLEPVLKEYKGSVIGLNRAKELMGIHLVNLALNSDTAHNARAALKLLKDFESGSPNNRIKILEDSSVPEVKNYYDLHKDKIANKINVFDKQAVNKAFREHGDGLQETIIDGIFTKMKAGYGMDPMKWEVIQGVVGAIDDGKTVEMPGYHVTRDGNKLTFTNYHGQSFDLNADKMWTMAQTRWTEYMTAENRKGLPDIPSSDAVASAMTFVENPSLPNQHLQQLGHSLFQFANKTRVAGWETVDSGAIEEYDRNLKSFIAAYHEIDKVDSAQSLNTLFPNAEERVFLKVAYELYSDESLYLASGGANDGFRDISKLREMLAGKDIASGDKVARFNELWEDTGAETMMQDALNNYEFGGNYRGMEEEVKGHARILHWFIGGDSVNLELAINKAVESFTNGLVEIRGVNYSPEDVGNPNMMQTKIEVGTKVIDDDWVDKISGLLGSVLPPAVSWKVSQPVEGFMRTGVSMVSNASALFESFLTPMLQPLWGESVAATTARTGLLETLVGESTFKLGPDAMSWKEIFDSIDDRVGVSGPIDVITGLVPMYNDTDRMNQSLLFKDIALDVMSGMYEESNNPTLAMILDTAENRVKAGVTSNEALFALASEKIRPDDDIDTLSFHIKPGLPTEQQSAMFDLKIRNEDGVLRTVDTYPIDDIITLGQWGTDEERFDPLGVRAQRVVAREIEEIKAVPEELLDIVTEVEDTIGEIFDMLFMEPFRGDGADPRFFEGDRDRPVKTEPAPEFETMSMRLMKHLTTEEEPTPTEAEPTPTEEEPDDE